MDSLQESESFSVGKQKSLQSSGCFDRRTVEGNFSETRVKIDQMLCDRY